jgi:hypothetical protein
LTFRIGFGYIASVLDSVLHLGGRTE